MKRFVVGEARDQSTLFPALLDDFIADDNPVRAIEAFVEGLDLRGLGFKGVDPHATGRPAYHPAVLLRSSLLCDKRGDWCYVVELFLIFLNFKELGGKRSAV